MRAGRCFRAEEKAATAFRKKVGCRKNQQVCTQRRDTDLKKYPTASFRRRSARIYDYRHTKGRYDRKSRGH